MESILGDRLRQIRKLKGFSLRDVEAKTGISNAYLSQLERGDAKNPSPKKLKSLAGCYDIDYADLLRLAGYLLEDNGMKQGLIGASIDKKTTTALSTAIQSADLTDEEEALVAQYIAFLKSQRK